ncbi:alpha/beta fold hydrolase [Bacillus sp. Marseille-P3661]|uniref:alpha/beta fold hydrolase n=1 Tax=Bacillus sp. Marseille-P3661 TaxID=1936234 RepID=UPI0015E16CD6|nr:alpha/beta hydrolase [Bacillus sp. Marseille-P3661]
MSIWTDLLGAEIRYTGKKYKTRLIEFGQGKPLILLHGNGGHVENFANNIPHFAKNFRTIAIDLLWHGYSSKPPFDPALIPSFTDQINDVMDSEKIESAYFVSQSMGAWPAMEMALSHKHRVKKLVLTTPQGFILNEEHRINQKNHLLKLREKTLVGLDDSNLENIRLRLERLVVNKDLITDEMVRIRHKIYNDPETNKSLKQFAIEYLGGETSEKYLINKERLSRIDCPTLVYWAENNSVPPSIGERLANAIKKSQYYCAGQTGHWAQFENHEEYNAVVTRFLLE